MDDLIVIRSSDRENKDTTFSHDCRIKLSQPLDIGIYKLASAVLPQTAQVLRPFDNEVLHYQHGASAQYTTSLAMTSGYYDIQTLVGELQAAMNARRAQDQPGETYTWTVLYSTITGRVSIGSAGSQLKINDGQYSMHGVLGFTAGQDEGVGSMMIAAHLPDLVTHTRSTQILLNDGAGGKIIDSKGRNSTFLLVPDENSHGLYEYNEKRGMAQYWEVRQRTREITVKILDAKYSPLHLQNAEWLIVLRRCSC